jgi:hypothetical protein
MTERIVISSQVRASLLAHRVARPYPELRPERSRSCKATETGGTMALLLILAALLLVFGIVGGIAITKFLFFVLIAAALIALIGFFTRTA